MKLSTMRTADKLLQDVINYMLAPTEILKDPGGDAFVLRNKDGLYELQFVVRWELDFRLSTPQELANDLAKLLEPVSKAITFGEVGDLRTTVINRDRVIEELRKENEGLRRYKDAWLLQTGKGI